ncbi:hypothetical protein AOLI_G00046650 [Acnodon oligacanthus]
MVCCVFGIYRRTSTTKSDPLPRVLPHRLYVADEVSLRYKDGSTVLHNDVKWYKDGVQLSDNMKNGRLEIGVVTALDSGSYACESGSEKSDDVEIKVLEKMVMLQISQRPAWSGDTVSLNCDVKGGARVGQVVFYKDGKEIKDASKYAFVISNVAKSDQGMYACNATYRFTHISKDAPTYNNMLSDQQALTIIGQAIKDRRDGGHPASASTGGLSALEGAGRAVKS